MSRSLLLLLVVLVSFPRVSGDEPGQSAKRVMNRSFSPRERG